MLATIRKQLETTRTNTHLMEALLNVMDRALAGRPISVNGQFTLALRAQERIGWRSLFHGHWALEWKQAYQETYATPAEETPVAKTKRHTTMDRWQSQLLKTTWKCMIDLWKIRKDDRHGRDAESREQARHEVLSNELSLLYTNQHQYPDHIRNLLRPNVVGHIQDTADQLDDWLQAYRETFAATHI